MTIYFFLFPYISSDFCFMHLCFFVVRCLMVYDVYLLCEVCLLSSKLFIFVSFRHTHRGNQNWKRHVYPNVHLSTVYNSQDMEATRCPSADEWIRKLWYIYTMEYCSVIKKNTFESVLMRWMKLEPIIQSKVSQKEKHQYSILMHIYGI